jgi:hypothetical protein
MMQLRRLGLGIFLKFLSQGRQAKVEAFENPQVAGSLAILLSIAPMGGWGHVGSATAVAKLRRNR